MKVIIVIESERDRVEAGSFIERTFKKFDTSLLLKRDGGGYKNIDLKDFLDNTDPFELVEKDTQLYQVYEYGVVINETKDEYILRCLKIIEPIKNLPLRTILRELLNSGITIPALCKLLDVNESDILASIEGPGRPYVKQRWLQVFGSSNSIKLNDEQSDCCSEEEIINYKRKNMQVILARSRCRLAKSAIVVLQDNGYSLSEISKVTGLTKEDLVNVNSTNKRSTEELVINVFNELFGIKLSISKNRRK